MKKSTTFPFRPSEAAVSQMSAGCSVCASGCGHPNWKRPNQTRVSLRRRRDWGSASARPHTGEQSHRRGKLPNAAKWHWAADDQIINRRGSLNLNQSGGNRPPSSLSSQYDRSWLRRFLIPTKPDNKNQWQNFIIVRFYPIPFNLYSTREKRFETKPYYQTRETSARGSSLASWTLFSLSKSTRLTFFLLNLLTRGIRPRLAWFC